VLILKYFVLRNNCNSYFVYFKLISITELLLNINASSG